MLEDMLRRTAARARVAARTVRELRHRAAASISRQEVMDHVHDGG